MRKINFLRTVLGVAFATLLAVGANAQVANNQYEEYDNNVTAPTNIDYITLRTGGSTTMGYYALPDPVYHPNYDAAGTWALTAGFVWNWTVAPAMATAKPGAANYVQITYTATGNYVVNVAEQAPAAMGGCTDATPTVMNVTVVAPPVGVITTADPAQACGNQAAATVALQFTEAVPAALAGYAFGVHALIENIDAAGNVLTTLVDADSIDFPTTGKLNTGNGLAGAASPYTWSFTTAPLNVRTAQRTRYTYTLIKASDAPGAASDGLISAISQKSDFIAANVLTYAFGAKSTFVAIVNPAPVTGPIYYIPNDYNY
jgi:hypothetical protein